MKELDKKKIGSVTSEERDEIKALFERKNGLIELFKSLATSETEIQNNLYDRIVNDMGVVSGRFQKWWDDKSSKYNWENIKGYSWEIDFETCEIYLRRNDKE